MTFNKKEKALISSSYFELIRDTEDYMEVRSINTGHCWIVKKHSDGSRLIVNLYHKHSLKQEYYHKQHDFYTVSDAVKCIKQHDEYVLNGRNN